MRPSGNPSIAGQHRTEQMRRLGRVPHRQPLRAPVVLRDHTAALERQRAHARDPELARQHHRSLGQRLRDVARLVRQPVARCCRPTPSWIRGAPGRERLVDRGHDRERLVVDDDPLQRVLRASPTRRDDRPERLSDVDRLVGREDRVIAPLQARALAEHRQRRFASPRRSSAVSVSTTPGRPRQAEVSTRTMRACAYRLLSTAMWSIPGRCTSATYMPRPVSSAGSCLRSTCRPMHAALAVAHRLRSSRPCTTRPSRRTAAMSWRLRAVHERRDRVAHRPEVRAVRVEHDDVGELAGLERADLAARGRGCARGSPWPSAAAASRSGYVALLAQCAHDARGCTRARAACPARTASGCPCRARRRCRARASSRSGARRAPSRPGCAGTRRPARRPSRRRRARPPSPASGEP